MGFRKLQIMICRQPKILYSEDSGSVTEKKVKAILHCNTVQGMAGGVQGTICFENRFPAL